MKTLAELQAIKEKMVGQMNVREGDKSVRVVVGMATCGIAAGARPVLQTFSEVVQKNNLSDVAVTQTGCIGLCQFEPIVEITKPGEEKVTYINMDADKAREVAEQHLMRGIIIAEYTVNNSTLVK
ncbi:MAG: (2Fe-2S) ferredoxin domain-containing protein [Oscillospiraceae bacterium]|nr:(2Fe-2S) ferredoxin domain-containing protein [Oscillospiraceae bacterium]